VSTLTGELEETNALHAPAMAAEKKRFDDMHDELSAKISTLKTKAKRAAAAREKRKAAKTKRSRDRNNEQVTRALALASGHAASEDAKRQRQLEVHVDNLAQAKAQLKENRETFKDLDSKLATKDEEKRELAMALLAAEKRLGVFSTVKVFKKESIGNRRGAAVPEWMRLMIYEVVAHGAPPSGVEGIVRAVLKKAAPFMEVKYFPRTETIKYLRIEIGLVSDSVSALRLAECKAVLQIGHDGTDVNGVALLAANLRVELKNGDTTDLMLRACFVALGKTSELEFKSILGALQRLKDLLTYWRAEFSTLFGENEESGLPDPAGIDLKKLLAKAIMSDNAAAAVGTSKKIVDYLMKELKEMVEDGDEALKELPGHVLQILQDEGLDAAALAKMSDDELWDLLAPIILTCARHTSNLLVDYGAKAELKYLKEALGEYLDLFSSFERVTADITGLLRATGKEFDFRSQATYPKGDAVTYFFHWLHENYPVRPILNSFRAMLGGRQDHKLAAAFELWWSRPVFVEFLIWKALQSPLCTSKLRAAIESHLNSVEVVGTLMARSIMFDKIFEPLRFFSANNDLMMKDGWTSLNMAHVYELVTEAVDYAKTHGAYLMDASMTFSRKSTVPRTRSTRLGCFLKRRPSRVVRRLYGGLMYGANCTTPSTKQTRLRLSLRPR